MDDKGDHKHEVRLEIHHRRVHVNLDTRDPHEHKCADGIANVGTAANGNGSHHLGEQRVLGPLLRILFSLCRSLCPPHQYERENRRLQHHLCQTEQNDTLLRYPGTTENRPPSTGISPSPSGRHVTRQSQILSRYIAEESDSCSSIVLWDRGIGKSFGRSVISRPWSAVYAGNHRPEREPGAFQCLADPHVRIYNEHTDQERKLLRWKGRPDVIIQVREDETQEYPDWTGTIDEFLESDLSRGINKTTMRSIKFLRLGCTLELDRGSAGTWYVTRTE